MYELLGVSPSASFSEIRIAFKHKAHSVGAAEYYGVVEAYKVLSDSVSRNAYNNSSATEELTDKYVQDILAKARAENIVSPVESTSRIDIVSEMRYTYYRGKGEKVDYNLVTQWYEMIVKVYSLFKIQGRPRVAVHRLGKAFAWSETAGNAGIAHFDESMRPSFIVALAAVLQSNGLKSRRTLTGVGHNRKK